MTVFIPIITYEIPLGQLQREIETEERRIEAALNRSVDRLLVFTAEAQILAYTSSANPSPPPGSTYSRTFNLQRASRTHRTGRSLPDISGEWYVDEGAAPYGRYVLGSRAEQARIHRGRWKEKGQVEKEIRELAPLVVAQETAKR